MVKQSDWKTQPPPTKKQDIGYQNSFRHSDAEKILCGHKPENMEDKWFIYSDEGWVYFVRSWTGYHIYAFQLMETPAGGAKVVARWVNTDPEQYRSPGRETDIHIINILIKSRFGVEGMT